MTWMMKVMAMTRIIELRGSGKDFKKKKNDIEEKGDSDNS